MLTWFRKRRHRTPKEKALAQVPFFSDLTDSERDLLEHIAHERSYVANEVIFDENEEGVAMYLVITGKVSVHRQGMIGKKEVDQVNSGEFFGELALLAGYPRSASATAAEPTLLLAFCRPDFLALVEEYPRLGVKLLLQLARHTSRKLRDSAQKNYQTEVV